MCHLFCRAVDPHSFYADPDPAIYLNVDTHPVLGPTLTKFKEKNHEKFSQVVKNLNDYSKVRNNGACANLLLLAISIFLNFFLVFR